MSKMADALQEALKDVYLSDARPDPVQRQLVHFDIIHPEHGKIGTLSGGRIRVGGEYSRREMVPGVEYARVPRNVKRGGKAAFLITSVGVHRDAVARIHGITGYDENNPSGNPEVRDRVAALQKHVLGHATVRELGRQLRKKMRVTAVTSSNRITGMSAKAGHIVREVPPRSFRESRADALIRQKLHEIAKPAGTGFAKMGPTPEVPDVVRQRTYYHGVASEKDAQAILRDGMLVPGTRSGSGSLHPMPGRVYLTTKPGVATQHAVHRIPNDGTKKDLKSGYGYIFRVDGSSLHHASADEDEIGELAQRGGVAAIDRHADRHLTDADRERMEYGGLRAHAVIGRRLSKHMTPEDHHEVISRPDANIAHHGPVRITGAWRVDRTAVNGSDWRTARDWYDRMGIGQANVLQHAEPLHHLIGRK